MLLKTTPVLVALFTLLSATAVRAEGTMSAAPSTPAGKNMLWNGAFDGDSLRPWSAMVDSPRFGSSAVTGGELCFKLAEPSPHGVDVVLRQRPMAIAKGHHYQLRLKVHATAPTKVRPRLSKISVPYTELWGATIDADTTAKTYAATYDGTVDDDSVELAIEFGGPLAGKAPLTVCIDDVELNDPQFEAPIAAGAPVSAVRANQVGYLPGFAEDRDRGDQVAAPVDWQLVDKGGKVRASGKTRPFGDDKSSGEQVQQIDFSSFNAAGQGLQAEGRQGRKPAVRDRQRRLQAPQARRARVLLPAAQRRPDQDAVRRIEGATSAPPGTPATRASPAPRRRSATTAWTSAAAGTTPATTASTWSTAASRVWALQNEYEMLSKFGSTAGDFGDGKLSIPEGKNSKPDLLDEARFGLEALLKMQVPAGKPMAGMVHQKMHGEKWSAIPTAPEKDDIKRFLRPVSTAATLNLAAAAAQAARLWKTLDPAFSARCLTAAETAYAAALKNPKIARRTEGRRRRHLRRRRHRPTSSTGRRRSSSSRPASPTTRTTS